MSRLPALDVLRALGAAAVVAVHAGFATGASANPRWGGLTARMDVGVAVFFVLSGFLLFRPWALAAAARTGAVDAAAAAGPGAVEARPPAIGRYLWRRALRILPAYWLTMTVCLLLLSGDRHIPPGEWLRMATLTQIYARGHLHDGLGHTWSLATEVAFYLLLPLLAGPVLGARWRPGRTLALLAAGGVAVTGGWVALMAAGRLDMGLHTMWLPAFASWFAAGMGLATAHVAVESGAGGRWRLPVEAGRAPLTCWAIAAGLFAVAGTPLTGPWDLSEPSPGAFGARMALFLMIAVALVLPVAFAPPGRFRETLAHPVARWLGTVSFGLFLWHPFVLAVLRARTTDGGFAEVYAATLAGGLLLGTASWYALERPLHRLARGFRPVRVAATATGGEPAGVRGGG
ncbi:acyltransferase [Actinoplanes sp. NPDC051851]|uniref:acyltransferase family protein n=1 Tax=Actinoplanes sp. NPDC051851 TaxID=3154753 RepID=UPI003414A96C